MPRTSYPCWRPGTALEGATASLQRLTGTGPVFWNIVFGAALPAVLAIARPKPIRRGPERRRVRLFLIAVGR